MDNTVHGSLQAKILDCVAFPFSRGSSQPRDLTQVSHISGRFLTWRLSTASGYLTKLQFREDKLIFATFSSLLYGGNMSSVQFSRSVMSDSLRPHESQHTRPPCPLPTPGGHPNPCPLSQGCHPTTHPLPSPSLLPSIFPSVRVFSNESALLIRWPKYWISDSTTVLPMNTND